jgi:non-specific serine/threonine protein kinase
MADEQGDAASAHALYEECLALQREIGDKRGVAITLINLGLLASKEGDLAGLRSCLAESLTLCSALGEKSLTAYALEGFAELAQAQEQPERAVRMYGASDALRAAIGTPLTLDEREEVERPLLARLRATLGEDAFESAWAAGHALTWEQAVAYALEDETP